LDIALLGAHPDIIRVLQANMKIQLVGGSWVVMMMMDDDDDWLGCY